VVCVLGFCRFFDSFRLSKLVPFLISWCFNGANLAVHRIRFVRRNRGWIPARAACQVSDRGRVRGHGPEAVGFSHGDFGFVVEALNNAAGKELLSAEIVEDQLAMLSQRPGDLFHRFDTEMHRLSAPLIKELRRPGGRVVSQSC
jgi:hypothetical protein